LKRPGRHRRRIGRGKQAGSHTRENRVMTPLLAALTSTAFSSVTGQLEEHDGDRHDRRGADQRHKSRAHASTGSTVSLPCCVMLVAVAAAAEHGDVGAALVAEPVVGAVVDGESPS
jgi:hypothetical protein